MSHTKVAVYRRDSTGYHKCVPQGIYPANITQFHLRYEVQGGKRTYERLPDGTDYKSAVRAALRKELSFEEVRSLQAKRVVPCPSPERSRDSRPSSLRSRHISTHSGLTAISGRRRSRERSLNSLVGWAGALSVT